MLSSSASIAEVVCVDDEHLLRVVGPGDVVGEHTFLTGSVVHLTSYLFQTPSGSTLRIIHTSNVTRPMSGEENRSH